MAHSRTAAERRRRAFLQAVAAGRTVTEAADHAGIPWSTLYTWRDQSAAFHAAWQRARERARTAKADRLEAALFQRAIDGIDEPVFHGGERIGSRRRYSDALLLAGLRALASEKPAAPTPQPAQRHDTRKHVTVVIEPFGDSHKEKQPPKPSLRPPTIAEPNPAPLSPPEPAEEAPALDWSHLGRNDWMEGRR
jgi:hypothetical protein